MKELRIITVFGSYNHGSFLQARCLYSVLKEFGNVTFIDAKTRKWNAFRTAYRRTKLFLRNGKQWNKAISILFFEIIEALKVKIYWKSLPSWRKSNNRDIYFLGSDEIWNVKRKECRFPIFWGNNLNGKKVAYAVSLNNATIDDFEKYPEYISYYKEIDCVSVRDKHSKNVLDKLVERKISIVLDPTLMTDPPVKHFSNNKEYIAVYSFVNQISDESIKAIKEFACKNNLELIAVGQTVTWCDKTMHSIDGNPFCFYYNAKYVITSTFHGTAYAINYKKNFIAFAENNQKIRSLLEMFGLDNRIVSNADNINSMLDAKIDYSAVDPILASLREESLNYIKSSINDSTN